jgi:hypothetical protein
MAEADSRGAAAPKRGPERRVTGERRKKAPPPPPPPEKSAEDKRLAERRTGLERRRPHLHYDGLTPHPRPDRNINDYPLSTDEVEFINAINDYKSKFNRPFPTWSEILHILRTLGYMRAGETLPFPLTGGPFDPAAGTPPPGPGAADGKG